MTRPREPRRASVRHDQRPPETFLPVFVDALRRDGATVDVGAVRAGVPIEPVWKLVAANGVSTAALTTDPAARLAREALLAAGVRVHVLERGESVGADLLVTGVVAAIAATGTLVLDPPRPGWRDLSSFAGVHLCVVTPDQLVATHADVPAEASGPLPTRRIVLSGPTRSHDAEPRPLHVVVAR